MWPLVAPMWHLLFLGLCVLSTSAGLARLSQLTQARLGDVSLLYFTQNSVTMSVSQGYPYVSKKKKRLCFLTSPIARTKEQIYLEEYDRNNYRKLLGMMWTLGTSHCASTLCDNCYQICPASAHGSQISWSTQNHLTCYRLLGWAGLLYLDGIVVST